MSLISKKKYEETDNDVKEIWDRQVAAHGRMTNMKKTLAHSYLPLRVYMDWYPMKDSVAKFLGERSCIIFVHALSAGTDCLICSTFFRKILIEWGENPDELQLNEKEMLLVDFAKQFIKDANNIPAVLLENLKKHFSEKQMVELTAFAGIMVATNLFNNALKIDLDEYLYEYAKKE